MNSCGGTAKATLRERSTGTIASSSAAPNPTANSTNRTVDRKRCKSGSSTSSASDAEAFSTGALRTSLLPTRTGRGMAILWSERRYQISQVWILRAVWFSFCFSLGEPVVGPIPSHHAACCCCCLVRFCRLGSTTKWVLPAHRERRWVDSFPPQGIEEGALL